MKKKMKKTIHKAKKVVKSTEPKAGIMPLGSRVLIRPFTKDELEKKNSFGIILPDSGKEKSEQGKVIAVGPGEMHDGKRVAVSVSVGDVVAFSKYGYDDITVNGEELYLIKEENILAVIN